MNKDMINIDDFVREKLEGHSEKEDSAAWLKMKALLDKEMPEKVVPFGFRYGKPLAMLGVALLVGALCVGGYEQLSSLRKSKNAHEAMPINQQTSIQAPRNTNYPNQEISTPINPITSENKNQNNNTTSLKQSTNASVAVISKTNNAKNLHQTAAKESLVPKSNSILKPEHSTSPAHQHKASVSAPSITQGVAALSPANTNATKQQQSTTQDNVIASNANTPKAVAGQQGKASAPKAVATLNSSSIAKPKEAKRTLGNDDSKIAKVAGLNNDKVNLEKANLSSRSNNPKEDILDSISSIKLVKNETTSKGFPKTTVKTIDTIAKEKYAISHKAEQTAQNTEKASAVNTTAAQQKLAANSKLKSNAVESKNNQVVLAANNPKKDVASQNISKAENAQKTKKSAFDFLKNLNFADAVNDAKRDLGNATFYFGFNGGVNYTSNNKINFQGVQFGPTGELVFNKHWSLFGAINYFNRSGGKKTVNDSYSKEISADTPYSVSGANWYYMIHTDSTNRYFNFSTLHSFEMPLSVRYAFKKFYVMTGINLAYYLKVNVEKVEKEYKNINPQIRITNSTKPILSESKPQLQINDFGSRFGVGYVLGVGYQMTPAWQVDLRVTNTFWDNAKGDGSNRLSKDFYRLPSMQLTFGYQFNRNTTHATYGPTSTP